MELLDEAFSPFHRLRPLLYPVAAVGLVSLYRAALPNSSDRNVTHFLKNSEVEGREVRNITQHPQTLSCCCSNAPISFLCRDCEGEEL